VDPEARGFSGHARIQIRSDAPREVIWLHAEGLQTERASLRLPDGSSVKARLVSVGEDGLVALQAASTLPAGELELRIAYHAEYGDHRAGLYRLRDGAAYYAFT